MNIVVLKAAAVILIASFAWGLFGAPVLFGDYHGWARHLTSFAVGLAVGHFSFDWVFKGGSA